jgi:mono/diheme cytochrome c family protein
MGLAKVWSISVFPILILSALLPGCQNPTAGFNPNAAVSPTYTSISSEILVPACVGCHGGAGGYSFNSYANTLASVVKGNPASSPLYTSVKNGVMPKGGPAPSSAEVKAVYDWIADSARNN